MRSPDLLVVNPNAGSRIYQSLASDLSAIEPPIWCAMIALYAQKKGLSVQLLDANAERRTSVEVAADVVALRPRLVAIVASGHNPSASTQVMPEVRNLACAVHNAAPGIPVLLLGGHVAALPEQTLREEAATYVATGEGPMTVVELTRALRESSPRLADVPGLLYWEGDTIAAGPPAPLVSDLDAEMPGLAWDLLPMAKYRAHNWHCFGGLPRQPYAALYTTLGCPFNCTFCCINAPFRVGVSLSPRLTYRRFDPETIVKQLERLSVCYGVRNVKIADEIFVLNRQHVTDTCRLIAERVPDLNMWAYARIDTVGDDRMLETMRRAGIRWLAFGIESGNACVRQGVNKGFSEEQIIRTVERARAQGFHVLGNYLFGLPDDDMESLRATLSLALELKCEFANFNCAMAYPGSLLYEEAQQSGVRLPGDWSSYSQLATNARPLATRHMQSAEVLRFRDQAFKTYYSDPGYLAQARRSFGDGIVGEIRAMLSCGIARDSDRLEPLAV